MAMEPTAQGLTGSSIQPVSLVGARCPRCASPNPGDRKFCGECGARLVPRCERREVSVLFVDVCGFTAMSERLDPEAVREIMDAAIEVIEDCVHRHDGTVNQFLGDGVMALFGVAAGIEDHPRRALRAAHAIQEGLEPIAEEVRHRHGVACPVRAGINRGCVARGVIGGDLRTDYTAAGPTTSEAARLLNVARAGEIVMSDYTRSLVTTPDPLLA